MLILHPNDLKRMAAELKKLEAQLAEKKWETQLTTKFSMTGTGGAFRQWGVCAAHEVGLLWSGGLKDSPL